MTYNKPEHKSILIKILKDIYTASFLGPLLGFKGGTAALLFYNLPRFSVDLDFDILDINQIEAISPAVQQLLSKHGDIKDFQDKRYIMFFLLSYHSKLSNSPNIKVEISKRNFNSHYELHEYLGIPMKVMVREDMAAHKMVAMHERIGKANRDIFDVWFFLNNHWPINRQIIELRTAMSYEVFLQICIDDLAKINNRTILNGLGELLTENQRIWVKEHLVVETIFLLRLLKEYANED